MLTWKFSLDIGNPDLIPESRTENDEKRRLPPSVFTLTPIENPDGCCIIKERMTQALRYFKESTEQHVLAQVWAPVKNGDRCLLTTYGQPFVLDPHSNGLHQYRMISLTYTFSVDGESDGALRLPARVFRQKLPEWTPNVQYYSSREYSRLNHALHYNVRGTLALPVFEPSGPSCVGVLELIMTSQKINYAPEVDKVCKALEVGSLCLIMHMKLIKSTNHYMILYFLYVDYFNNWDHGWVHTHVFLGDKNWNPLTLLLDRRGIGNSLCCQMLITPKQKRVLQNTQGVYKGC